MECPILVLVADFGHFFIKDILLDLEYEGEKLVVISNKIII